VEITLPPRLAAILAWRYAVSKQRKQWASIVGVAEKHEKRVKRSVLEAIHDARESVNLELLILALEAQDHGEITHRLDFAVNNLAIMLAAVLPNRLSAVLADAGNAAATHLPNKPIMAQLAAKRNAAKVKGGIELAFDETNPAALEWADAYAAELIKDISATTRSQIQDYIVRAFTEGIAPKDAAKDLLDIIGDSSRAETIARTETMNASLEGQRQMWDQAIEQGYLTGNESREWIANVGACDDCEELNGTTAPLDGAYDSSFGPVDGPPLHPNCRCSEGIVEL
jgi:SPP1 gp7 family putative phage head morphogenesis protein